MERPVTSPANVCNSPCRTHDHMPPPRPPAEGPNRWDSYSPLPLQQQQQIPLVCQLVLPGLEHQAEPRLAALRNDGLCWLLPFHRPASQCFGVITTTICYLLVSELPVGAQYKQCYLYYTKNNLFNKGKEESPCECVLRPFCSLKSPRASVHLSFANFLLSLDV